MVFGRTPSRTSKAMRAVLQNARRLDDYFAQAVRAHPDKFIGLADVDETNACDLDRIVGLNVMRLLAV
jgi:hypothetical protein